MKHFLDGWKLNFDDLNIYSQTHGFQETVFLEVIESAIARLSRMTVDSTDELLGLLRSIEMLNSLRSETRQQLDVEREFNKKIIRRSTEKEWEVCDVGRYLETTGQLY